MKMKTKENVFLWTMGLLVTGTTITGLISLNPVWFILASLGLLSMIVLLAALECEEGGPE
tara:strand:- start:11531 stop:11710 length:180 start_codon:yes stop_codon:yes gene_type:complete